MAEPKKIKALLTAPFVIHNPSRHKRAMLLDALKRSHLAYTKALAKFLPCAAELQEEFGGGKYGKRNMADRISRFLQPMKPLAISAKRGIAHQLAENLLSYLALLKKDEEAKAKAAKHISKKAAKKKRPRRPPSASRINDSVDESEAAYEKARTAITLEETNAARDALFSVQRMGKLRPMSFLENKYNDGYLLLYSPEKKRFFIWLNLHPKDSRFAAPVTVGGLVDVRACAKEGLKLQFGRPIQNPPCSTGAIFPVDFGGDYQMKRFIENAHGHPQSAELIYRREGHPSVKIRRQRIKSDAPAPRIDTGRFEVMITFEFAVPAVATENYLGIDRGMDVLAALCVVDKNGVTVTTKMHGGDKLRQWQKEEEKRQKEMQERGKRYSSHRRRALADAEIHAIANSVVEMAQRHRAQVVLENLEGFSGAAKKPQSGGRAGRGFWRGMNRHQYAKLARFLDYKLPLAGLPKPETVDPDLTSRTCPECGDPDKMKVNRQTRDHFKCGECGYEKHADLNAARVIALKKLWEYNLSGEWREEQKWRPRRRCALLHCEFGFAVFLRKLRSKRQKRAD